MNANSTTDTFPIEDIGPGFDNDDAPDFKIEEVPAHLRRPRSRGESKKITGLRSKAKDYKSAYRALYGLVPVVTYDGKWIRLQGVAGGVSPKRLDELTRQLRARLGK